MPNPHHLIRLRELRQAKKISLTAAAEACGLLDRAGRDTVSAWERGLSVPHPSRRPMILRYLLFTLGLQDNLVLLAETWNIVADEWRWQPLEEGEILSVQAITAPNSGSRDPSVHDDVVRVLAPLPATSRMPYYRNPYFVGRTHELAAIAHALTTEPARPLVLTGMGGIGKTQLAVECAYRIGWQYEGGVFWLSFADGATIPTEIAACGGSAGLVLRDDFSALSLDTQIALVQEAWQLATPRLLIFDNCEDPEFVQRWRPSVGGCRLLITSRRSAWGAIPDLQVLSIGAFTRAESCDLLGQLAPPLARQQSLTTAVAAELDDLPLAIHLAGSYLARNADRAGARAYLANLRQTVDLAPLIDHQSLRGERESPTGHIQHLARTFQLSYAQLQPEVVADQVARQLLARAAAFAPGEPVPVDLLLESCQNAGSTTIREAGLLRLIDLGLIQRTGAMTVRVHRLIVAFVERYANDLHAIPDVEQVLGHLMDHMLELERYTQLLVYQNHLQWVVDRALRRGDLPAAALAFSFSSYLHQIEAYPGRFYAYNAHSLAIRRTILGEAHPLLAENIHQQAWMLDTEGRSAEAIGVHTQALHMRQKLLGADHAETAASHNYLGTALHAICQYQDARSHYEQGLAIRQQVFGVEHPNTAQSHNNLGLLCHAIGDYQQALFHHQRALAIREQALDSTHPRLAITLNNYGYLLRTIGRYPEARSMLDRALAIREQHYGPRNTYVAITLSHLARLAHLLGEYQRAKILYEQVIELNAYLPNTHHDYGRSYGNLGMLLFDLGDHAAARVLVEKAITHYLAGCGPYHRQTARCLNHLGIIAAAEGSRDEAQRLFQQALAIREQLLDPMHPDIANTRSHLAMLAVDQGELTLAHNLIEQALAAHRTLLGTNHPYTARSLLRSGLIARAMHQSERAQQLIQDAITSYTHTLGAEHPFTVAARQQR